MRTIFKLLITVCVVTIAITAEWIVIFPASPKDAHDYAVSSAYVRPNDTYVLVHQDIEVDESEFYYTRYIPTTTFMLSMNIDSNNFDAQIDKTQMRFDCALNDAGVISMVDANNEYICRIAQFLNDACAGDSDMKKIKHVMQFVDENIKYNHDSDIYGISEYWATPIETLYLRTGDCEDRSVVACSIMLAMGYESGILDYRNHCAPYVVLDGVIYSADFDYTEPCKDLTIIGEYPKICSMNGYKPSSFSHYLGRYVSDVREMLNL